MAANNSVFKAIIVSPQKSYFRLEYLLPPDQMQARFSMVITIHHRHERSYGNAWITSPDKEPKRWIGEIVFPEQPRESHLFTVLAVLRKSIESSGVELGRVGELYLPYFYSKIQELLEKRAEAILDSPRLTPLEKAKKIYALIVSEGMEAKYEWVKKIHELAFEGGAETLFDANLCEVNLYRAQEKFGLGREYLVSWVPPPPK